MAQTALTSCVTVSRLTLNHMPHPKVWRQRSACEPLGFSRKKR
jgi:hypothetical protein